MTNFTNEILKKSKNIQKSLSQTKEMLITAKYMYKMWDLYIVIMLELSFMLEDCN